MRVGCKYFNLPFCSPGNSHAAPAICNFCLSSSLSAAILASLCFWASGNSERTASLSTHSVSPSVSSVPRSIHCNGFLFPATDIPICPFSLSREWNSLARDNNRYAPLVWKAAKVASERKKIAPSLSLRNARLLLCI